MRALLFALVALTGCVTSTDEGGAAPDKQQLADDLGDGKDEVGQIHDTFDPATGWDHLRFYRNVAFELAARGL